MPTLKEVQHALDHLFQIKKHGKDSGFSRYISGSFFILLIVDCLKKPAV